MTISHPRNSAANRDHPFVFAALGGFTCSICAPVALTAADIEKYAAAECDPMPRHVWRCSDKSKMGLGSPTPNPCNQVSGRQHWFLLAEVS